MTLYQKLFHSFMLLARHCQSNTNTWDRKHNNIFVQNKDMLLSLLFFLLVRLHDQSNSSDEVGGLLQVLQAPI